MSDVLTVDDDGRAHATNASIKVAPGAELRADTATFRAGVPATYELTGAVVLQSGTTRIESTGGTYYTETRTLVSDSVRVSSTAETTPTL